MKKILKFNFFSAILQKRNMFSIEGIDGVGKTTQAHALEKALLSKGYNAIYVTNPSNTTIGKFLRKNLNILPSWQKISLFLLDMINVFRLHKDSDEILIWDRYTHSTLISNKNIEPHLIAPILKLFPRTKITFFLNIDPEIILKNRKNSVHDHSADLEWQRLKQSRYMKIIKNNPSEFFLIDGNLPQNQITKIILDKTLNELAEN